MRKIILPLFISFICQNILLSQADLAVQQFIVGASTVKPGMPVYLTNSSGLVKEDRSILLSEKFSEATIYLQDTLSVVIAARYNIKLDRMEYLAGPDTIRQIYPQQVQAVVLDGQVFLPLEYYKDFTIRIGWFEVKTAGEISLLVQREAYKRKTDYNPGAMKIDNYVWDSRNNFYAFVQGEQMPVYFYPSKRNVLDILNLHRAEIQSFMKENKVRISQPGALQLIFTKYNQLVVADN
ncbi:MAG: hypothetical protein KDC34_04300 [Saprospiraceae bacterium]|nr:hypothetical protein [Saprospiraceae bacterium]